MDQEELERRRKERQEVRLQRQKRRKRRSVLLAVGAAVLVLLAVVILVVALVGRSGPSDATANETTIPPEENPDLTVIHLAAAGDLNITEAVVASGGSEYDYTDTFLDVVPLLAHADLTAVNFEGNFYGAPYGIDRSAPEGLATSLSKAGVDLVQLANSYTIYKGMDGLSSTVRTVRSAGMEPVGAYANTGEAKSGKGYTLRTVDGVKVAFVAFTKGMDGMALPAGNEGCVNLLYTDYASAYQQIDKDGIRTVLSAVDKAKPDVVVALLHWGSEYNNTISQSQLDICEFLQDNGVDAIIGTHSHYVQEMVFDPEKGTFVAYSLGDFCGDASRAGSEYSVVLDLEITKNHVTGETKVTGYSYTPIFTVAEEDKPIRVVRIHEAIAAYDGGYIEKVEKTTYDAMQYALERIEARVHPQKEEEKTED